MNGLHELEGKLDELGATAMERLTAHLFWAISQDTPLGVYIEIDWDVLLKALVTESAL